MNSLKKPLFALIGVMTALFVGLLVAGAPAGAYPAGTPASLTINNAHCGQSTSFTGSGYKPGETVTITVNGHVEDTTVADSSGDVSGSFKLKCHGDASVTITATGSSSGAVDSLTVSAGNGNGGGGSNNGGGGLSSTGVAVVGIGAVGVVLLLGGGLLLFAGKRRRVSA